MKCAGYTIFCRVFVWGLFQGWGLICETFDVWGIPDYGNQEKTTGGSDIFLYVIL